MPEFPPTAEGERAKWEWLREAPRNDRREPAVRELASNLYRAVRGNPRDYVQLCHAFVRDVIAYQTDRERVGREDIPESLEGVITRRVDDCDSKARLFCALCLCAGISARMLDRWEDGRLAHVSAAVQLGGTWFHVETILRRARLGDEPIDVPTEPDGRWMR